MYITQLSLFISKIRWIKNLSHLHILKFIFCTETWLPLDIEDKVIGLCNYKIIRQDKNHERGGGVCVYHDSAIESKRIYLKISIDSIEYLCFISHNIIYALFYILPDIASGEINVLFEEIIDATDDLHKQFHNKHTIFLGDFNRSPYRTLCANLAFKNIVTENTRGKAILDICLVSKEISDCLLYTSPSPRD